MFGAATNAAPTGQQQQQQPVASAAPDTPATTANASNAQGTGNNNNSNSTWAFHAKLRLAVDQGIVSEALADEIRVRFAAPFDISGVSVAQAPGNSNTGITNAATAVAGGGVPWLSLATQQSRATETRQKDLDARHVVVAMELLNLLLMCDSGYYNSESNTTTATTGEVIGEEGGVRGLHAAVATIARSASSNIVQYLRKELTSSSLGAESLTTLVQRHAVPLVAERSSGLSLLAGRHAAMDGLSAAQQEQESRMWHLHGIGHNPIILSAQCLYLLTRHFQLQASSVKELLELVELLLLQLPYENSPLHNTAAVGSLNFSRGKALRALCQTPATAATSALLWLVVFAAVNTVAVWKKLRGVNGELAHNVLLHSDVAALLAESTRSIRQKVDAMEEQQQQHHHHSAGRPSATMTDPFSFLSPHAAQTRLLRTPGTRSSYGNNASAEPSPGGQANRASGALLQQQQALAASATAVAHRPWLDALAGFVSVLTLAEGCLLRAKGDERGYDRALEAFIGDRSRGSTGSGGGAATTITSNTAMLPYASPWRGTVAQRMVQLAPITEALRIPAEYVYIAPYEMLSYVFDSLVPVLRRLAELELASYRRYIDQMQLNEPLMMMSGGGGATNDMTGSATGTLTGWRNNNCNNTSGGYLLANGITRDGSDATLERRAMRVIEEPFTTYMAPILAALATCLSELPSEVLNPDLDSDCAATFFIFRNCARHLVHVFAVQQQDGAGSSQWQDFTLKTVTQFLNVLTMIGRHAQYLPRLIAMLSGTQAACPELHWGSLMAQAIECAGLNTTTTTSNTESKTAVAVGPGRHRQFTLAYSRRRRQEYLASCFLLLRQLVTSRALRGIVNDYLSLDAALAFLAAPRQSQGTLGSTLSLLAALIASAEDAARVFDFLTVHKLLLPSSQAASETSSSSRRLLLGSERGTGTRAEASSEETTNLSLIGHARYEGTQGRYPITIGLLHLLIALCRYDIVHGSAATLTGYTALVDFVAQEVLRGVSRRLFLEERERWSVMALAAAALRQALLVRFVATPPEALSTTNNNNSRDISAVSGAIPLTVVMATNKAPNDILGELLQCIYRASIAPYDLGSLERAALRQCLRLLNVALHVLAAQQLELFAFEARTVQSESLAYHLLLLCGVGHDEALLASCLELLLLLPAATVTQAARQLHAMPQRLAAITGRLATLLQPGSLPAPVIRAPPELAFLDTELDDTATCWQDTENNNSNNTDTTGEVTSDELRSMRTSYTTSAALSVSHKALLLDLLIQHASMAAPSLTLLLCGFYDAAMTHGDGRVEMCNRNAWDNINDNNAMPSGRQDEASNSNAQGRKGNALFASVLDGVMSRDVERDAPALAVKYVKLLYLLRANVRYGTSLIRPSMERGSQHLFFQLQHFAPSLSALKQRHEPLLLCRYAYILRLLALETVHTARSSAAQLSLRHGGVPRVSVEVLLSLLLPSSSSTRTPGKGEMLLSRRAQLVEEQNNNEPMALLSRSDAADLAQWLTQVLHSLPVFPSYELPPSVRHGTSAQACYTVLAADGVVQLDLVAILEALQRAQAQRQLPPLSFNDLRERLRPFVVANDCLMHYAAVTSFVEAWCQLVGVACGVVRHLPQSRLRTLAQNILAGVALTRGMTAAAQERVVRRLFFTLSTVLAHLLRRVQEEIAEDEEEEGGMDNDIAQQDILSNAAAALQQRQLGPRRQHRRRRPREEYEEAVSGQTYSHDSIQVRTYGWRRGVSNQCLLRPLLTAVVQWGTTLPSARVDLYNSLFCWIMIPGVELEDIVLYRTQEALLRLLAQDISCTSEEGNVNGAALRWSATTLLIRLLTRSSTLSDAFCKLGLDTHTPLAVQCGMALLSTTSQAMSAHFAGSADAALVLDAIQNCFDFLCAIALRHGGKLALCGPLLATCLSLDVWTHGTQVMLGTSMNIRHTAAASSSLSSATTLTSSQLVWCGFLRGVLRWLNVILMNSGYANNLMMVMESENECPPLLAQLRDFVAARRQLLETALHMPLLVPTSTSSVSPVVVLDHTTLSLCAEFVRLLRGLASANGTLAIACRTLVHEMSLPELLHSLCTLPMSDMTAPALNTATIATSASQRLSLRNAAGGTLHSTTPMTLISIVTLATAVRDTAHLLLRAECAGLYDAGNELTPMTHLQGQGNDANKNGPLIRDNAAHVECIVHATEALTLRVQGVRRAYTAQPSAELVLSYESYLLALQALVCLIHSLVLPLKYTRSDISSNANGMPSYVVDQNSKVRSYLSCLPLAAIDAVLRQVQQMVSEGSDDALYLLTSSSASQMANAAGGYASRDPNTGRAYLTPATEETVVAAAMRAAQRQDKSTRPSRRRAEDVNATTLVTPRQTSSGPAAAESVMREASLPATPLIHPADGTRLMGTRPTTQQQQQQQPSSIGAAQRGAASETRRMSIGADGAMPLSSQPPQPHSLTLSESSGPAADPDTTLGDLLASTTGATTAAAEATRRTTATRRARVRRVVRR